MASIEKRGNSYRITVFVEEDKTGKQKRVRTSFSPTATAPKKIEKEVAEFAANFEREVKEGRYYDGEKMTYRQFAEQWKTEWAQGHLTQSQSEDYENLLKNRIFPSIGSMKLSKIKTLNIQTIINNETKAGKAPKTVRRTFTAMNSVFRFAYKMGVISNNPCDRVELPRLEKDTSLHYFTLEQSKRFLSALDMTYTTTAPEHERVNYKTGERDKVQEYTEVRSIPTQFKAYFYLAVYGGFRRGELVALQWKNIDFEEHTVSITQAAAKVKGAQVIKAPKTASGVRTITLPPVCFSVLNEWMREEKALSLSLGTYWKGTRGRDFPENFVFIQNDGSMMYLDTPLRRFKQILRVYNQSIEEQAAKIQDTDLREEKLSEKLPEIRLHDLRHTSATLLLSEGADIMTVSHRLGHSSPSITLDVYSHALPDKDTAASDTLEKLFGDTN